MIIPIIFSGCSRIDGANIFNSLIFGSVTINGTVYDASRSFELVKFCSGASFDTNPNPNLLNCSIGNITDTRFNNVTGNWSCMSCLFDSTKCATFPNIANITLYDGLNLTAEHIISSDYDSVFTVMCCNSAGIMCYRPILNNDGKYQACGAGYNELVGSITFNNVSNNWSVTSCLNGFK
jgi:hypothetical protein